MFVCASVILAAGPKVMGRPIGVAIGVAAPGDGAGIPGAGMIGKPASPGAGKPAGARAGWPMEPAVASVAPGAGIPAFAGMVGKSGAGTGPKGKPAGVAGPKPVALGAGIPGGAGMVGKPMGHGAGNGPKGKRVSIAAPKPVGAV